MKELKTYVNKLTGYEFRTNQEVSGANWELLDPEPHEEVTEEEHIVEANELTQDEPEEFENGINLDDLDREAVKKVADELSITYAPNIGTERLKARILESQE